MAYLAPGVGRLVVAEGDVSLDVLVVTVAIEAEDGFDEVQPIGKYCCNVRS